MTIRENLRALGRQPVIGPVARRLMGESAPLVPVLRLAGVIGAQSQPFRSSLTLAGVAADIDHAFSMKGAKAVALAINSPGGAPVQSALIMQRIRQLSAEKDVPVYAFIEDVGASGGYMLALAGEEIYADANSVVGSIGVVSAGFGFTGLIGKLGIERRLYTSGESKAMLDPFSPEKPDDVAHLRALQEEVHENFKAMVRERRAGKLKEDEAKLFSGAFWTGAKAEALGLVDGVGDMRSVLRGKLGDKLRLRLVNAAQGLFRRRQAAGVGMGVGAGVGTGAAPLLSAADLVENGVPALEARALWSRYGL